DMVSEHAFERLANLPFLKTESSILKFFYKRIFPGQGYLSTRGTGTVVLGVKHRLGGKTCAIIDHVSPIFIQASQQFLFFTFGDLRLNHDLGDLYLVSKEGPVFRRD